MEEFRNNDIIRFNERIMNTMRYISEMMTKAWNGV